MKPKSISGLIFKVKDLNKSAEFYEKLGFVIAKKEPTIVSVRINWFWVELIPADYEVDNSKPGQFTYITVDDVDQTFDQLTEQGIKVDSEPADYKTGRREVMISDPDGYKLVFFSKK